MNEGKKDNILPFRKKKAEEPKRVTGKDEERWSVFAWKSPEEIKVEMIRCAEKIERVLSENKEITPMSERKLMDARKAWEGLNEYALLNAATSYDEIRWLNFREYYSELAKALRKKAGELKSDY